LLRSGQWQGEVKQRARDGRELTVATHWIVYTADDGSPTGVAEVHNDVTELRRAEAEIRDADRRKDLFIATLAHELRNPLAPLRNGLDLLQVTRSASDDEGPILEIMHRQMEHIVRMVDDLLDISRLNTGRVELRRDRVMLADVVRDAVEACRCQLNRAGQELAVSLPQTPVALYADSARLVQIFVNLLSNAGKFTPSGGRISLSARLDGECVAVHIRDTGAGIPAPALPHIFDTFVQFDKAGSGEGLGLGLSIVRMLVEMHGGRVEAHSAGPGQGSEFIVRLPMTDSLSGARSDAGSGVVPQTGTPTTHRILVVDDNRDAARMLSLMLNKNGFECREAYSGPSALLEAAEFAPDAFLLDLGLPGMNGLELARAIRSIPSFHDTLLIAVSGWDKEEDRRQTREAGFDHHFAKPVAFGELQKLLVNRLQPAGRMPAPIQPVVALPTTATGCCS
jgi:signal transduction histidine kinase/CheY-like chemotaxis protein